MSTYKTTEKQRQLYGEWINKEAKNPDAQGEFVKKWMIGSVYTSNLLHLIK